MESFKNVDGFDYLISNYGTVKSIRTGKNIKPYLANGYYKIDLYKNSKRRKVYIHQLVCETFSTLSGFIGAQVNHKDGNKLNNNLSNLEWVTCKENINHFIYKLDKGNKRPVIQMDKNGSFLKKWPSIIMANRSVGKKGSGIFNCCKGKNRTAYGFKWKYA